MVEEVQYFRNIGISAHIDSGKTTLTERILYYTNRIFAVHEVKGKDGVGAKMDSMELERERGITISSAATYCNWKGHKINIIDTPGHVDFTIEVERAEGAGRVYSGLMRRRGVQSQSMTVDRQMNRYKVPRVAFVNKCDRSGADPFRVVDQLRQRLNHNAVLMQIPIGLEGDFSGVIDLVSMEAVYFAGPYGGEIKRDKIPSHLLDEALQKREEMLDAASLFSDELTEAILEERVTEALIHRAVRRGTIMRKLTPVLVGSAYKNIGVQPVLDAVVQYLPSPAEVENISLDMDQDGKEILLTPSSDSPLVALAFKPEVTPYGQLTHLRIYQGSIGKGDDIVNTRDRRP